MLYCCQSNLLQFKITYRKQFLSTRKFINIFNISHTSINISIFKTLLAAVHMFANSPRLSSIIAVSVSYALKKKIVV